MQVSHQADHITSAVINKAEVIEFTMSDSAEFFGMLSSNLYSNPKMAMIREVMCNGWDAHIAAGITDKPMVITLENGVLTIRDYGLGIPHSSIGAVYGTYGKSTKTNDGKQTGGFGLGSKSPFAYTDHFEVVSHHGGVKTIYRMVKASLEGHGKPGIIPIATLPTEETGLSVSINIQAGDVNELTRYIELVAANGEMNVLFNFDKLPTLPFSQSNHGFLITNKSINHDVDSVINIRYGNVIYPVQTHADFEDDYSRIVTLVQRLGKGHYADTVTITFQAPPHSISVTPSRESLHMQEHTITTIKALLAKFTSEVTHDIEAKCLYIVKENIDRAVQKKNYGNLLTRNVGMPGSAAPSVFSNRTATKTSEFIQDAPSIARQYTSNQYPDFPGFYAKDIKARLDALIASNYGNNRGLLQSFKRNYSEGVYTNSWFHKTIVRKLARDIMANPMLSMDRLKVYDSDYKDVYDSRSKQPTVLASGYYRSKMVDFLPFLRNIVVIAHNNESVAKRLHKFPQMKELGECNNFLFYHVPRVAARVKAAQEFFSSRNFVVLDLTLAHAWEEAKVTKPIAKAKGTAKPIVKGIPTLSATINESGNYQPRRIRHLSPDSFPRTEAPEFLVRYQSESEWIDGDFGEFTSTQARAITVLFGDKGGVYVNPIQEERYKALGAVGAMTYITEKVSQEFITNKRIKEAIVNSYVFTHEYAAATEGWITRNKSIAEQLFKHPVSVKKFKLKNNLTETDKQYLVLWRYLQDRFNRYDFYTKDSPVAAKAMQIYKALKPSAASTNLYKKIKESTTLQLFSPSSVINALNEDPVTHKGQIDATIKLILTALKN